MTSVTSSGTQFFWPKVSLESVKRECKRNGDSYKAGHQDGVEGYWITVSRTKDRASSEKPGSLSIRHDHRIRSTSPLPLAGQNSEQLQEKKIPSKTASENVETNKTRRTLPRRLSAVLLKGLESSSVDDNTSIWEGLATGAQLKYIKGELLGKGSFGEVREVSVDGYDGSVARKSMFLQGRNKQKIQKEKGRIKREVENLQRSRHKHIVSILDCYAEQEKNLTTYYLIMSPVGVQDLETLLEIFPRISKSNQEKYRARVSRWMTCLASALAYMHSQGVRHEDIKPSNIINRGDHVYFTDFSSSRVFQPDFETATTSTVEATRRFAAPEVLDTYDDEIHIRSGNAVKKILDNGKIEWKVPHGSQSDVFSLALVLAEMTSVFNRSIADMHAYVLVLNNSRKKPLYHEVIDRLEIWFTKELKSQRGLKLWQCCLHSMLKEKRVSRPYALEVVHTLQREQPVGKFKDDGCLALLPQAPKAKATTKVDGNSDQDTKTAQHERPRERKGGGNIMKDTNTAKAVHNNDGQNPKVGGTGKAGTSKVDNKKLDKPSDEIGGTHTGTIQLPKKKKEGSDTSKPVLVLAKEEKRKVPKDQRQISPRPKSAESPRPQRRTGQAILA